MFSILQQCEQERHKLPYEAMTAFIKASSMFERVKVNTA